MDKASAEPIAVNVTAEANDTFYAHMSLLPKEVKSKLSFHDVQCIFRIMVIPAIDRARALDRGASPRNESELEQVCAALLAADERGQGQPWADAMERLNQLIGREK